RRGQDDPAPHDLGTPPPARGRDPVRRPGSDSPAAARHRRARRRPRARGARHPRPHDRAREPAHGRLHAARPRRRPRPGRADPPLPDPRRAPPPASRAPLRGPAADARHRPRLDGATEADAAGRAVAGPRAAHGGRGVSHDRRRPRACGRAAGRAEHSRRPAQRRPRLRHGAGAHRARGRVPRATGRRAARARLPRPPPHPRGDRGHRMIAQQLLNALMLGSNYALVAIGYTLVFGILNMLNFAHPNVFALGGFLLFAAVATLTLPFPLAVLVVLVGGAVLGLATELLCFRPAEHLHQELAPAISSVAFALVLTE